MSPLNLINLFKLFQTGRDTSVHGQVLLAYVTSNWHSIEDLHEHIVDFNVEPLQYFVPERERFSHVARLVIAPQKHNVPGEVLFDGEEQNAHFDSKDASVDIVAEEEVIETARLTSFADHVEQVSILSMDVADNADRLVDLNQVGLCG